MGQKITSIEEFSTIENNTIIGKPFKMDQSVLEFQGTGNLLFFDEGLSLDNTSLRFLGNNSVIFLCSNKHVTRVKLDIFSNSVFYLGRDANTTRPIHVIVSERKHIIIGDDCLFSRDVWFRNADPHLIYDNNTMKRTNSTKSIFLGDHVWIGQNVLISKGTKIGSGSVVGGWSMTAGKKIASNCISGGSPVKIVKRDVFWRKPSVHSYNVKQTKKSKIYEGREFIFEMDDNQLAFDLIEKEIDAIKTAQERLVYLQNKIYRNREKNRFFVLRQKSNWLILLYSKIKKIGEN